MTLPAPPQSDADRALIDRQWLTSAARVYAPAEVEEMRRRLTNQAATIRMLYEEVDALRAKLATVQAVLKRERERSAKP